MKKGKPVFIGDAMGSGLGGGSTGVAANVGKLIRQSCGAEESRRHAQAAQG